jgi:hypothetical protein
VNGVDANHPSADRRGSRRAILGLGAIVSVVAMAGVAVSLLNPSHVTSSAPVTGLGFSVAYDAASRQVVLFGGLDSAGAIWLWDGGRWTQASPSGGPSGVSGAAAAYDPASRMVMLFGGSVGPRGASDNATWAWNGTSWRLLSNGLGGAPPGEGAQMAWDSATNEMVLVTNAETATGAETWSWSGSGWTRQLRGDLSISVSADVMAYDPKSRSLLLVSPVSPYSGNSLTLSWQGSTWHQLDATGPEIEGLALDPQRNALIGCGIAIYSVASKVQASCWEWTGDSWFQIDAAVPPPASRQMMIEDEVADAGHARVLMFGWLVRAIPGQPQPLHIWSWDGGVWTQRA